MKSHKKRLVVAGMIAATLLLTATSAFAVLTTFSGSSMTALRAVTSTDPAATAGTAWVDVPGAAVTIPAPAGGGRLLARFSGESTCANVNTSGLNYCRTRIVLSGAAGGGPVEFHPQSNLDYLWDNTVDGRAPEAHAMERLYSVPQGTGWVVKVQYNTTSAGTELRLDDWTFVVETIAP